MSSFTRRSFMATGLAGASAPAFAQIPATVKPSGEDYGFVPSTLFLTWFRDPTTTMVVQWVGTRGETSDTKVYYRPAKPEFSYPAAMAAGSAMGYLGHGWRSMATVPGKFHPDTDFKMFRAELAGLTPDTDYEFKVGKNSPTYRFRTMPTKQTNSLQFISGGDCGVNVHALANNVQAARQDPAFALIGGDLAYDNGKSVEAALGFLRNYSKSMYGRNGRMIPMVACLGNHEVEGGYEKPREKAPFFFSMFDGLFKDTSYATLDFGNYLSLVLLDSGHISKIDGDQTDWLEKQLKARKDHPNLMVVNHVPAYPSARDPAGAKGKAGTGELNRKHWVPLFEQYRVPVVLEHHDHTFKRTKTLIDGLSEEDGVLYLGDGSWGRLRSLRPPEKLNYLAAASMDYHLTLHRLQGEQRYHLALDENGRVMDISHTSQRSANLIPVAR